MTVLEARVDQTDAGLAPTGEERPLRQWDFVHCPPGTQHAIVGAGEGCTVLAIGAREHVDQNCHGGAYMVDEVARRYGASVDEETTDASLDYARMFGETNLNIAPAT
jgi:hypothetical protein